MKRAPAWLVSFFRSPPEAKGTYAEVTELMATYRAAKFLEEFTRLPMFLERRELTKWEKFKTYLPWSYSRNHETKLVKRAFPKSKGATIKFVRHLPFETSDSDSA